MLISANDVNEHAFFSKFFTSTPPPFEKKLDPRLHDVIIKKCFTCPKYTTIFSPYAYNPCFNPILIHQIGIIVEGSKSTLKLND